MGTAGQFYSDVNLKGAPDIHCPVEETCIRYKSRAQAQKCVSYFLMLTRVKTMLIVVNI